MNFEIASGSIVGTMHSNPLVAKANQDGHHILISNDALIAVVCDGCSGGMHSEVGAKIGARLIAQSISLQLSRMSNESALHDSAPPLLERVRQDVLAQIRLLANAMGGSLSQTIGDYFLFTALGVVITPKWSWRFSIGDGVFFVNGQMNQLGPFAGNEPPYLAYPLVQTRFGDEDLAFKYCLLPPTSEINSLLIGSDGVLDLAKMAEHNLPGKQAVLGPISQFWDEDRFFENPDNTRRRLALANKSSIRVDKEGKLLQQEHGLLSDDTTVVVIRRAFQPVEDEDASSD